MGLLKQWILTKVLLEVLGRFVVTVGGIVELHTRSRSARHRSTSIRIHRLAHTWSMRHCLMSSSLCSSGASQIGVFKDYLAAAGEQECLAESCLDLGRASLASSSSHWASSHSASFHSLPVRQIYVIILFGNTNVLSFHCCAPSCHFIWLHCK